MQIDIKTELCELFLKYHSDKCPQIGHSYSPHYYEILKNEKNNFINILEIGVGNNELMKPLSGEKYQIGGSLKALRDFFPKSKIYGLDIRRDVLFSDERIECLYTDQSSQEQLHKTMEQIKNNNKNLYFDLIIDDGSHIIEHMVLSFEILSFYLKTGGIYIIEDIKRKDLETFLNLNIDKFEIIKVHTGFFNQWDNFVAYKKL